jgi:hypothetical protein
MELQPQGNIGVKHRPIRLLALSTALGGTLEIARAMGRAAALSYCSAQDNGLTASV